MEFFEKAHLRKSKESSRKEHKSEENKKKQLKKMLFGYKNNDNEVLKKLDILKSELDETSSISGYSDLNFSNSSDSLSVLDSSPSGDMTQETVSSNDKVASSLDDNSSFGMSSNIIDENNDDISEHDSVSVTEDTVDYDDDKFFKDLPLDTPSPSSDMSNISDDTSFLGSTTDNTDSNDTDSFDQDGALAAKILEKLGKQDKKSKEKCKKRKIDELDETEELISTSPCDVEYKGPYNPKITEEVKPNLEKESEPSNLNSLDYSTQLYGPRIVRYTDGEVSVSEDDMSQDSSSYSEGSSSPFVSIKAGLMANQCLEDILGDYRHPTMKNLPSDFVFKTNNANIFIAEGMNVDDIIEEVEDNRRDEEVDSLVPEIDEELSVADIDLNTTELEASSQLPNEESTVYDDTIQSEDISQREISIESTEIPFVNPVKVYYGKNNCVFVLKHPAELFIHGKVRVTSLGGTVEVLGYTLRDELKELYAPNYNFAHCLKTVQNQNGYYGLFGKLTTAGLSVTEAEEIVTTIGDYDGVISLQQLKSRKMDFVENNFTVSDLFSKPSKSIDNSLKKASEMLGCSLYISKPWKSFEENVSWKQAIKCGLNHRSKGIVCGGKGVGKSTFLRYYVNKMLAQGAILVIDLDPGQCEFTPAGNIAATVVTEPLLGPNFTHLRTPEKMLNIGMINTMDNPRRYAAAVESLIGYCSADGRLGNMPWILNTMGMTNIMGLKFISHIILQTKPTFLLQIDSKNAKKRYDYHLYPQTIKNLYFEDYQNDPLFRNIVEGDMDYTFIISHHSENSVKHNFSLAPRDERYLSFLAYFGELLNTNVEGLLGIVPYEVNLKDLNVGVNVKINEEAVAKVLNGKVVALCQRDTDDNKKVFTLGDRPLVCYGQGLIRGIDWEKGVVYIITPAAGAALAAVNTVVYADWVPELRGQEAAVPGGTAVPYRTASQYSQRQLMFAPKRRFNPLQLLKMSRST